MAEKSSPRAFAALRSPAAGLGIVLALLTPAPSLADEGGNGVWLPGAFSSMAAVPGEPGWSLALVYYHYTGTFSGATGTTDAGYVSAAYAFATPVLGGQLTLSLTDAFSAINVSLPGNIGDSRGGIDDLLPMAAIRWNTGVNNFLAYAGANMPLGVYDPVRLANPGLGHWAIDGGTGYTYYNPKTGYEFSAVAGLTYNFPNPYTSYQNGLNLHLDMGASKFLTEQLQAGLVGYYYQQLTPDQGPSPIPGGFQSSVVAIGPQLGYSFPIGNKLGFVGLKGYREFPAENRPTGWNVWLTFSISPQAPKAAAVSQ